MKRNRHLVALDFDGTQADTFSDSPHGLNVHIATELAIEDVFGSEGIRAYEDIGGMQNREPGEMVRLIEAQLDPRSSLDRTELFVSAKLEHLLPEISPDWPKLYPGVKDFFTAVATEAIPLDLATVSSGHDSFIRRVYAVNAIPGPPILVIQNLYEDGAGAYEMVLA